MSGDTGGEELYVDVESFRANNASVEAVAIATDLVFFVWKPAKVPFVYDADKLSARLNVLLPGRGYTAKTLRVRQNEVATFFTALRDGNWVPNPQYFGLTDENT